MRLEFTLTVDLQAMSLAALVDSV